MQEINSERRSSIAAKLLCISSTECVRRRAHCMDRDGERDRVSGGGGPTRSALFCSPAYPILEIHQM